MISTMLLNVTTKQRYAMYKIIFNVIMIFYILLLVSCAKSRVIPTSRSYDTKITAMFPKVIFDENINIEGVEDTGLRLSFEKDILKGVNNFFKYHEYEPNGNTLDIVDINVSMSMPRESIVLPMALISTPLFFLSFARQPINYTYSIEYGILDNNEHRLYQRTVTGEVSGRYLGWSFFRYIFHDKLVDTLTYQAPHAIADLVCNDLVASYKSIILMR